jgi:hypothetical protein
MSDLLAGTDELKAMLEKAREEQKAERRRNMTIVEIDEERERERRRERLAHLFKTNPAAAKRQAMALCVKLELELLGTMEKAGLEFHGRGIRKKLKPGEVRTKAPKTKWRRIHPCSDDESQKQASSCTDMRIAEKVAKSSQRISAEPAKKTSNTRKPRARKKGS